MTTAIRDIHDLFRIVDEDSGMLGELRRRVIGEDLLALPARFEAFVEEQRRFNEEQLHFNEEQRRFNEEQRHFNEGQRHFNEGQRRTNAQVSRDIGQLKQDVGQLQQDVGQLKGAHARNETVRRAPLIAMNMGYRYVRTLDVADLAAMAQNATADIDPNAIASFVDADLVMEATAPDGQAVYIALEVSYTGNRSDTRRAMRNAEFLTRFTGRPAHSAIASVRNDPEIAELIDGGQVHWHRIRERDLEPT